MRDMIKDMIKEEVSKHLAPKTEQLDESLLLTAIFGGIVTAGAFIANGVFNSMILSKRLKEDFMRLKEDESYQKFVELNMPNYERETQLLIRKFQYAKNLNEVMAVEKDVDKHIEKLERLRSKINSFSVSFAEDNLDADDGDSWLVKKAKSRVTFNMADKDAVRRNVHQKLDAHITRLRSTFEIAIQNLRDSLDNVSNK